MATTSGDISPSTAINDNDHGALVKVAAGFCAALMLLSLAARLQIRWPWRSLFGKDDSVAVTASVSEIDAATMAYGLTIEQASALAQMIVVFLAVAHGFGRTSDELSAAAIENTKKVRSLPSFQSC